MCSNGKIERKEWLFEKLEATEEKEFCFRPVFCWFFFCDKEAQKFKKEIKSSKIRKE